MSRPVPLRRPSCTSTHTQHALPPNTQALLANRSANRSPAHAGSSGAAPALGQAQQHQQQEWQPIRGSYSLNDLTVSGRGCVCVQLLCDCTLLGCFCTRTRPYLHCARTHHLQLLQQPSAAQPPLPLHWAGLNSKLVSAKPKLEPVPEGWPSHMDGGALHLLPLGCTAADAQTLGGIKAATPHCGLVHTSSSPALPVDLSHVQLQKRAAAAAAQRACGGDSPVENESSSDSMPRSLPSSSCNTLSTQLQLTHVTSESQLSSLEHQHQLAPMPSGACGGAVQGSTAAAVETFRQTCTLPTESMAADLQGCVIHLCMS